MALSNDLVPMLVRTYRRAADLDSNRKAGEADWPAWNELDAGLRAGMKGDLFIHSMGTGWIAHDNVESLGTGHEYGQHLAMVPEAFAEAAHARWPHLVAILTEAEAEAFYDTRFGPLQHDAYVVDQDVVDAMLKIVQLEDAGYKDKPAPGSEEYNRRRAALDPTNPARGVRANPQAAYASARDASAWKARMKPGGPTRRPIRAAPEGHVFGLGR